MKEFFHMGGYAFYVWLSYGISFAVMGIILIATSRQHRQLRYKLAKRIKRKENKS